MAARARVVIISLVACGLGAHTITFCLPPHFRVVFAAYLSVALGLILSFARRRPSRTGFPGAESVHRPAQTT